MNDTFHIWLRNFRKATYVEEEELAESTVDVEGVVETFADDDDDGIDGVLLTERDDVVTILFVMTRGLAACTTDSETKLNNSFSVNNVMKLCK